MANRAYLYSSDRGEGEPWDWQERVTDPYCDSHWTIPLAWFFFFDEPDVRLVQASPRDAWQEVHFWADRRRALHRFRERMPLLLRVVGGRFDPGIIEGLLASVGAFPKAYLLLDATEVFGGFGDDDEWHFARCRQIIGLLSGPMVGLPELAEAARPYCASDYPDLAGFYDNVVGHTYT